MFALFRQIIIRSSTACGLLLSVVALAGCPKNSLPPQTQSSSASSEPALFKDVAVQSGLNFKHVLGASGHFHFIEQTPAGCAFLDFDGDGFQDVFLVQSGSSSPANTVKNRPLCALYHNNKDGTFKDVTRGSGLDKDLGYAQGVAVGDFDNDGFDDLFVTAYGGNHLFHNNKGSGKFEDVTVSMGLDRLHDTGYATSAAWGDYDGDGRLDLAVCYYGHWNYALDKPCRDDKTGKLDYCAPKTYEPVVHQLYHNEGNRFVDVTEKAGISKTKGRGLAVAWLDFNDDGKQDLFVANDGSAAMLWQNNGNGTFSDVAGKVGCAFDNQGHNIAGMSVSVADYDHSGRPSIYVSNYSHSPNILFKNEGGTFSDATQTANLAFSHLRFLSFGSEFIDFDADGWPDIISNNGHVQTLPTQREANVPLAQAKQLLQNKGDGTFREITDTARLGDLTHPIIGRGLAVGDFDNDGRVDVLAMGQNAPVQLFRNQTQNNGNHWVGFQTVGTKSNRDGIGAKLEIHAAGMRQTSYVRGGSSYLSSSDRRVYFGLGKASIIESVAIRWPSGTRETLHNLRADRYYLVKEGHGITTP